MNHADRDQLTEMVEGYLRAALWTWIDEDGNEQFTSEHNPPLADVFDFESIVRATLDCQRFCTTVAQSTRLGTAADMDPSSQAYSALGAMDPGQAGHDLWLTREGHGAGFWDRGLGVAGERLTAVADTFGEASFDCHRVEVPMRDAILGSTRYEAQLYG